MAQPAIIAEAEAAGISKGTLDRAKKELEIKPKKGKGLDKSWIWELPTVVLRT